MPHSKHRFFHSGLKDIYAACILPVENDGFAAPNALSSSAFQRTEVRAAPTSAWANTIHRAPSGMAYPPGGAAFLSSPFDGFDPSKPPDTGSSRKRPRSAAIDDDTASASTEPKRKSNGQKRKEDLQGHFRTYKIRMLPTRAQRQELDRCFRVARCAYNWANECVREGFARPNHYELRSRWRANKLMDSLDFANTSATRVSSNIASRAIQQLTDAYASNFAKRRRNSGHTFQVRYRSHVKTPTETIIIDKDIAGPDNDYKKKTSTLLRFVPSTANDTPKLRSGVAECLAFFGNNLTHVGGIRLQDKARVIARLVSEGNRLHEDAKIRWDKATGQYHFIYLHVIPKLDDPEGFERKRIVATDPGCSPFQQWYSPTSGNYGQLLAGARPVLKAKCQRLDALHSRIDRRNRTPSQWKSTARRQSRCTSAQRRAKRRRTGRRLKRKLARDRRRLRGWVEAAHYDAAHFLLKDHEIVIQPVLQIQRLTAKAQRCFGSKMARAMYTWSHHLFRQRLKSAAARYPGRHVFETTEPGTSKTCTHCGCWKADLRLGDKRFDCSRCGVQVDRQVAGARNNFFAAYGLAVGMGWDGV